MSQPTPYLGSKISLISKSEIRYEGILYTVDTKESTIALAKVQSFGTEDRPTTNPVAPREETYDYIIFKASDIKDLIVCETPKPSVPQLGLPYDPAILSVSQAGLHGGSPNVNAPAPPPMSSPHPLINVQAANNTPTLSTNSRSVTPNLNTSALQLDQSRAAPGGYGGRTGGGMIMESVLGQHGMRNMNNKNGGGGVGVMDNNGGNNSNGNYNPDSYHNALMNGNIMNGGPRRQNYNNNRPNYNNNYNYLSHHYNGNNNDRPYRDNQYYNNNRGNYYGNYNNYNNNGRRNNNQNDVKRYDSDYDFDKANKKFEETLNKIEKKTADIKIDEKNAEKDGNMEAELVLEDPVPDDPEYYNAKKSFFDKISCEASEKKTGRRTVPDKKRERTTNVETFGNNAVRNYDYRRGRGRGYSYGRGGYNNNRRGDYNRNNNPGGGGGYRSYYYRSNNRSVY